MDRRSSEGVNTQGAGDRRSEASTSNSPGLNP